MYLYFDTETTGKGNFKLPVDHPDQPRIVQLGAILEDKDGRVVTEINLLVRPDNFTIPEEATKVHGISTELASKYGFKIETVISIFYVLTLLSETIVAHNIDYDRRVVEGELTRLKQLDRLDCFKRKLGYCTMKSSTNLCKLPGPYGLKWPTLQEAYKHFFGEEFSGAHDAMADVRACQRIFKHLKTLS